jgi:hypothetical protein
MSGSLRAKLDEVEAKFGRGPFYGPAERELILEGKVPEWLLRGRKLLKGSLQERCSKAVTALTELHDQTLLPLAEATVSTTKGKGS